MILIAPFFLSIIKLVMNRVLGDDIFISLLFIAIPDYDYRSRVVRRVSILVRKFSRIPRNERDGWNERGGGRGGGEGRRGKERRGEWQSMDAWSRPDGMHVQVHQ